MAESQFKAMILAEGACVTCGRSDVPHYASMRCKACYYKQKRIDKKADESQ